MATSLLFIGGIGLFELIFLAFPLLALILLWPWALFDLLTSKFESGSAKLIWLIAILFVPVLGPILYLFIGRKQKVQADYM